MLGKKAWTYVSQFSKMSGKNKKNNAAVPFFPTNKVRPSIS